MWALKSGGKLVTTPSKKKSGGTLETPRAKKGKHTGSSQGHIDKLGSGCVCACDTHRWWRDGDELLSQTMKCRRSRAYKPTYSETTDKLLAERVGETEMKRHQDKVKAVQ